MPQRLSGAWREILAAQPSRDFLTWAMAIVMRAAQPLSPGSKGLFLQAGDDPVARKRTGAIHFLPLEAPDHCPLVWGIEIASASPAPVLNSTT